MRKTYDSNETGTSWNGSNEFKLFKVNVMISVLALTWLVFNSKQSNNTSAVFNWYSIKLRLYLLLGILQFAKETSETVTISLKTAAGTTVTEKKLFYFKSARRQLAGKFKLLTSLHVHSSVLITNFWKTII